MFLRGLDYARTKLFSLNISLKKSEIDSEEVSLGV